MSQSMRHRPLACQVKSKFTRSRKRKRVTLIAAFRCYEGVVLCADSQETIDIPGRGEYRVNVTKIEPRETGECEIVIGGGGDGDLVDDFVDQLTDRIGGWTGPQTESQMRQEIRAFVVHFYEVDVQLSPAHPDDKNLGFVVCLKHRSQPEIFLWRVRGLRVFPIPDKTLLGWEEAIYWHEVDRLYQPNSISNHAMLLGIHLFLIAKATSNVISGETKIILARDNGIHVIPPADVTGFEEMLRAFNKMVDELRLTLPNMSIPMDEFRVYVTDFKDRVIDLHERLLGRSMEDLLKRALTDPNYKGDPYSRVPPGTRAQVGPVAGRYHFEDRGEGASGWASPSPAPPEDEDSQESEKEKGNKSD